MKRPPADHTPSLLRKAAFYALTLLLVYGILEVISLVAYVFVAEDFFSFSALQARRTELIRTPGEPISLGNMPRNRPRWTKYRVIHPYIGFVSDAARPRINKYGFQGPPPPIDRMEDNTDTVFVAVLGGSVAAHFFRYAGGTLRRELRRDGPFARKRVSVHSFALGGLKQPQQLMIVNYFMSIGAHFDLVINLDGFNEMVLPIVENARARTNPFYPRGWKISVGGLADRDQLREAGHIVYLESIRQRVAGVFSLPLRYSVTANLFWDQLDLGLSKHIAQKRVALTQGLLNQEGAKRQAPFAETGPRRRYASDEARYVDMAAYWKRSSLLLNSLAQGSGFHYFHFLQPNQHVPGSKIFTDEERAIAFIEGHPYRQAATEGYPYLIEAGKGLAEAGVHYTDLTMLFANNDEVLYADGCCHFNQRGYELIAQEIARVIRENLGRR